jgi:hypothetical protein
MAARKTPRVQSKKSVSKKVGKKKPAAKKTAGKTTARKTTAKKKASTKPTATLTKKALAKKAAAKPAAKKPIAKQVATKKSAARKPAAKTAAPKKSAAAKPAKKVLSKKPRRSAPPMDALSELVQKRSILRALTAVEDGKTVVDAYMRDVDHPFKAEMQAVRQIILNASPKISERIKWNAPSFHYKEDLGAFHPRATEYAHLILLFPEGAGMQDDTGLLEGSHKDRREAKFHSMADVAKKKPALEALVKHWVELRDS